MSDSSKLYYKTCREYANLTQEQAISLLGITEVSTLSRYENGHATVPQETVAAMVKVYRTKNLASWHVEYANPDLVPYLRGSDKPNTDGDAMLQLDFADDGITEVRNVLKAILRDGNISPDELAEMGLSINELENIAGKIMSAVSFFKKRVESTEKGD